MGRTCASCARARSDQPLGAVLMNQSSLSFKSILLTDQLRLGNDRTIVCLILKYRSIKITREKALDLRKWDFEAVTV